MVSAAHSRGMQFHAWFNPFRATTDASTSALASNHVAKSNPEWIVDAGGKKYINPGIPAARQHIIDTVLEVVKGYDVDGVHLDDYFYPSGVSFADDTAYKTYNTKNLSSKADWRRDNINEFVRQLGEQIHKVKPKVSYGISPFGVWRNIKKTAQVRIPQLELPLMTICTPMFGHGSSKAGLTMSHRKFIGVCPLALPVTIS